MKIKIWLIATVALFVLATGCKKNPNSIIGLPEEVVHVGSYMDISDVQRIGHALNNAATRQTVQWENDETGYQYSMMVFTTRQRGETVSREFTVLTIAPMRDAEVLNLVGSSSEDDVWVIEAEGPAAAVGKAARMELAASPVPDVSLSSGKKFNGFQIVQ